MVRSDLERQLDAALKELYPVDRVREDVPIKITKRQTLYVDRIVGKVAIEVDGRQHSEFSKFHHGDSDGFKSAQERDRVKEAWLLANGYAFVRIQHNEKITSALLRKKILEALND